MIAIITIIGNAINAINGITNAAINASGIAIIIIIGIVIDAII
jgi:hypothetical protein